MISGSHPASRDQGGLRGQRQGYHRKAEGGTEILHGASSSPRYPLLHLAAMSNVLLFSQEAGTCPLKQSDHETWDSRGVPDPRIGGGAATARLETRRWKESVLVVREMATAPFPDCPV